MAFSHSQTLHLLDLALHGDRVAMSELLARHKGRVLRIVRARLGPQLRQYMESQDIVQEVFLSALQAVPQLEATDEAKLLQWLSSIVENTLRGKSDYHGALKRTSSFEPFDPGTSIPLRVDASAEDDVISREREELVDHAVNQLPKELRDVFVMRHYMGHSFQRIAESLPGTTANQVRMAYRRARARLVRLLDGKL
ncbi:MAG: sigma-70 family RNA polymerase sigma factor [Planctomycetes bacterium]|nr:sigma-70 family RNA polymerase sigma factor [Planctomycetota bacterium]